MNKHMHNLGVVMKHLSWGIAILLLLAMAHRSVETEREIRQNQEVIKKNQETIKNNQEAIEKLIREDISISQMATRPIKSK